MFEDSFLYILEADNRSALVMDKYVVSIFVLEGTPILQVLSYQSRFISI